MTNQLIKNLLTGAMLVTLLAALTQTANATPHAVPDGNSTCLLMGVVCTGLAAIRKFVR
jgi:hypothetical protein